MSAPRRSIAATSTARSRSRANVSGRSSGEVGGDLQKILADTKLPPGYRFVFGGSTKDMAESAAYAGQALLSR